MLRKFATVEEWDADCDRVRAVLDDFIVKGRDALKECDDGTLSELRYELLAALRTVNEGIRGGTVPESTRGKVLEDIELVTAEIESRV